MLRLTRQSLALSRVRSRQSLLLLALGLLTGAALTLQLARLLLPNRLNTPRSRFSALSSPLFPPLLSPLSSRRPRDSLPRPASLLAWWALPSASRGSLPGPSFGSRWREGKTGRGYRHAVGDYRQAGRDNGQAGGTSGDWKGPKPGWDAGVPTVRGSSRGLLNLHSQALIQLGTSEYLGTQGRSSSGESSSSIIKSIIIGRSGKKSSESSSKSNSSKSSESSNEGNVSHGQRTDKPKAQAQQWSMWLPWHLNAFNANCSSEEAFKAAMGACARLQASYDQLMSNLYKKGRHGRARHMSSVHSRGTAEGTGQGTLRGAGQGTGQRTSHRQQYYSHLRFRLVAALQAQCGWSSGGVERRSMERVRAREMQQGTSHSTAQGRQPCRGDCAAVGDETPLDWGSSTHQHQHQRAGLPDALADLRRDFPWAQSIPLPQGRRVGEGGALQRYSQLAAAWSVWRVGRGMLLTQESHSQTVLPLRSGRTVGGGDRGGTASRDPWIPFGEEWGEGEGGGGTDTNTGASARASAKGAMSVSILLQYWSQPELLPIVVESYTNCSQGAFGRSPPTEILVNVDQPNESALWLGQWAKWNRAIRSSGHYMLVVFNHNLHEVRGYNMLARAAQGDLIVLVQDDDFAPRNCSWLARAVHIVSERPRVAAVAYHNSNKFGGAHNSEQTGFAFHEQAAFELDNVTGILSEFVELTDIGPIAFTSSAWESFGGLDEALGPRGQSGIFVDWHVALRISMSGQRTVATYLPPDLAKRYGPFLGGTHRPLSVAVSWRESNYHMNRHHIDSLDYLQSFITSEMKRLYMLLLPLNYWNSSKYGE